jgi:hypothetical protein
MIKLEILIWDVWIHSEEDGFTRFGSVPESELQKILDVLDVERVGTALIWR